MYVVDYQTLSLIISPVSALLDPAVVTLTIYFAHDPSQALIYWRWDQSSLELVANTLPPVGLKTVIYPRTSNLEQTGLEVKWPNDSTLLCKYPVQSKGKHFQVLNTIILSVIREKNQLYTIIYITSWGSCLFFFLLFLKDSLLTADTDFQWF